MYETSFETSTKFIKTLNMELTPYQRLEMFWQTKGIRTASGFAETVGDGVTAAAISAIKKRGSRPGAAIMRAIQNRFPDLNADWVLWGNGEMLLNGRSLTPANQLPPPVPDQLQPSRPGFPVPGEATPAQADFVGKYITTLEAENARLAGYVEWLQAQLEIALGKPLSSVDAAAFTSEPRTPISMRPAQCRTEAKVIPMWPAKVAALVLAEETEAVAA